MVFRTLIACLLIFTSLGQLCSSCQAETLELEDAVRIALSSHQRIQQAQELYSASAAMATAAHSDRLPSVDFNFSYDHLRDDPTQTLNGIPVTVNDRDMVHYAISVKQPLFTGFALSTRQKLAELDVDMAAYDLQQARRQLALDVNISALQLLQIKATKRVAKRQQEQFKNHLADVKAAYDQGMVAGNDRLKAEVALATADQQLQRVTSQVIMARSRLNLLIGRPQQNPLEIIEPQIVKQPQQNLTELINIALQHRPEIHSAKLALTSSGENIRLINSRNYPQVALVASYWRDGDDLSTSHNAYSNKDNASIGIHLDWNLFSGGADHAKLAANQHRKRARRQALIELQDMVRLQVEDAFQQLEVASKNQQTAIKAQQQARENHRLSILQFYENIISTNDLLDAQTLLTRAETNLQAAHYGILLADAQLSFALGKDPLPDSESN